MTSAFIKLLAGVVLALVLFGLVWGIDLDALEGEEITEFKQELFLPADASDQQLAEASVEQAQFVSFARFSDPERLLEVRTAKQSLSAMIKVFPIEPSTSRDCVRSYTRSLSEFDRKGSVPCAVILFEFYQHVDIFNAKWQQY